MLGARLGDEREVGETHAALGVCRLMLAAELGPAAVVDLEEARHVRRGAARHDHVIRGDLADLRERLDPVTGPGLDHWMLDGAGRSRSREPRAGSRRGGGRYAAFDEPQNV